MCCDDDGDGQNSHESEMVFHLEQHQELVIYIDTRMRRCECWSYMIPMSIWIASLMHISNL